MSDSNVKKFVPVKGQDLRDLTKDCKNMQEKHAKKYSFFGNMEEFTIYQKSTPEKKETETEWLGIAVAQKRRVFFRVP